MSDHDDSQGVLMQAWGFLWSSIVRVLWLCAYATVAALGVALLFLTNDQGQELLRISAERGLSAWNLAFLLGALLLGLTLWYTSRLLLAPDFGPEALDRARSSFGRTWLPRVLGVSVPLSIGAGFLLLETPDPGAARVLGGLFIVLGALLLWFFIQRRTWFLDDSRHGLETPVESLSRVNWGLMSAALGASFLLLAGFVVWPVALPQTLGTPAIVLISLAGIALFGGLVLTYAFLANGQPAGTALVLALAIIAGLTNDNHAIRVDPQAPALERLGALEHYQAWRRDNPPLQPVGDREPLILVAASGGGIRAAYWTASTLATLESIPGFSQALFAISSVSGGSVGAAVYTSVKRLQLESGRGSDTLTEVERALSQDFLSPAVAGLLFPDLLQRLVPVPFPWADRQRFLELAFERSLGPGANPLSRSFTGLYSGGYGTRLPSLLLNTTVVDSGRRALLSNILPEGFTDTLDLLGEGFSTRGIRLSAAAGASARFTYVSPAGSLTGPGEQGDQKIRLVDGGYFENSGAATSVDLLNLIDSRALYPILILIRNDPQAPPVCRGRQAGGSLGPGPAGPHSRNFLSEVASPLRALLSARTARGRLAEVDAAKRMERSRGAVIEISLAAAVRAELERAPSAEDRNRIRRRLVEPPLGWSLSEAVREAMAATLREGRGGLAAEVANLSAVLEGRSVDYVPCGAR